jgi:hypothetical protein
MDEGAPTASQFLNKISGPWDPQTLESISMCFITRSLTRWKFSLPAQEMGGKTQNGGPHLLVLYWRAGEIHVVKDNGSGWLRWLLTQGGVILTHPKHRDSRCALELPSTRYDYSPPIQRSLQLINISKRKAEASSSSMPRRSCNFTF